MLTTFATHHFHLLCVAAAAATTASGIVGAATVNADRLSGSGFYQCHIYCPLGYHVASSDNCSVSCNGPCPNEVYCEENAGFSFYQCMSGWAGIARCPDGYHIADNMSSGNCSAPSPNEMRCDRNQGNTFNMCTKGWANETFCPAGYHTYSIQGCSSSCSGTCPNIMTCAIN